MEITSGYIRSFNASRTRKKLACVMYHYCIGENCLRESTVATFSGLRGCQNMDERRERRFGLRQPPELINGKSVISSSVWFNESTNFAA